MQYNQLKEKNLEKVLKCPNCNYKHLNVSEDGALCLNCKTVFHRENNAINFISSEDSELYSLSKTKNISSNSYNQSTTKLLDLIISRNGLVLDCGSGLREFNHTNLIQSEIVAYDNVDILSTNQKLPFKDNAFDLILSLDVLEHVTNPFLCAKELNRCLANNGLLLIDIPFLQAEHGYPNHYFNVSRSGMKYLFSDLECITHVVPPSGHPFHVIWSILRTYKNSLPSDIQKDFNKLTIKQILDNPWTYFRDHDFGKKISNEGKWILASTTQAVFQKKYEKNHNPDNEFIKSLPTYKDND